MDELLTPLLEDLDHVRGEPGAPLELVMFGDFQCPFCLGAQSILRRVHERLDGRLLSPARPRPRPAPPRLPPLPPPARAPAAAQGRFWDYHDALYANQPKLSPETMLTVAGDLGLDVERMQAELDSGAHRDRVARDLASATASGATGTPTFFINGKRFFGAYDAGSLVEALEADA